MVKTDSLELFSPGTDTYTAKYGLTPSEKFGPPLRDEIMYTHKHISLAKFEPAAYLGDL